MSGNLSFSSAKNNKVHTAISDNYVYKLILIGGGYNAYAFPRKTYAVHTRIANSLSRAEAEKACNEYENKNQH